MRRLLMVLVLAGGPALAADPAPPPAAAPLADDEILVVDEEDLDRMWRRASKRPTYVNARSAQARRLKSACVTVGFVIESDGRVRTANVLRSQPPGALDADGLRTARSMRFRPGPDNAARLPVYSVVSWSHGRGSMREVAQALEPCIVDIEVPRPSPAP